MRGAFVVLALWRGTGVVLYLVFWAVVPLGAERPRRSRRRETERALSLGLLAVGVTVGLVMFDRYGIVPVVLWPLLVAAAGVAVLWWQADEVQRARWRVGRAPPATRARRLAVGAVGGLLVATGTVGVLVVAGGLGSAQLGAVLRAVAAAAAALLVVTGPWWWRLASDYRRERDARIRSQERAEVAAHVHDSVLQTLALIQRNVDSPREVTRLARRQERELRAWLHGGPAESEATFGAALHAAAAEVEDAHGVRTDVVLVGDRELDERVAALVGAAREAMVNAAKHSGESVVAVYAEVEADRMRVFVRDRGVGFEPAAVRAGRFGVAESIAGRMSRHGGRANVRSTPGEGTEVELELPL